MNGRERPPERPQLRLIQGGGEGTPDAGTTNYGPPQYYGSPPPDPWKAESGHIALEEGPKENVTLFSRATASEDKFAAELSHAVENLAEANLTEIERQLIKAVRKALAEKYGTKLEDFELVTYKRGNQIVRTIVYAASSPLDVGDPKDSYDTARSWESVMNGDHTIDINGVIYDTLKGMTLDAYVAFAKMKKRVGLQLPNDSEDTSVLLTGEEPDGTLVKTAHIDNDAVKWDRVGQSLFQGVRIRPAVELPLDF